MVECLPSNHQVLNSNSKKQSVNKQALCLALLLCLENKTDTNVKLWFITEKLLLLFSFWRLIHLTTLGISFCFFVEFSCCEAERADLPDGESL
jgi:hypothetical protein